MDANYLSDVSVFSAGGVLLDRENNKVFLIHKKSTDEWLLPKGRLEKGQTIEETAQREIFEETGYNNEVKDILRVQVRPDVNDPSKSKVIFWFLSLLTDANRSQNTQMSDENFSGEWLNKEDALDRLTWEGDKNMVEKVFAIIS